MTSEPLPPSPTGSPHHGHGGGGDPVKAKRQLKKITKQSGRRLVEYFLVVSSVPRSREDGTVTSIESSENGGWTAGPPSPPSRHGSSNDEDGGGADGGRDFVDDNDFQPSITSRYPLEDHDENPLHESVACFCHPSGTIRLRTEPTMPKVHYFVATGGRGEQMYGTCLTMWEPFTITSKSPRKAKNTGPRSPPPPHSGAAADDVGRYGVDEHKLQAYLPKCLVLLSMYPYLVAFREYLTQLHRLTKRGDMPLPVERYVSNFCAEIPAPPPGSFEVQTTMLESVIKIWSPPHNQPIPWVSLPWSHLFECLDLDHVVTVWHALALERQVLLTSTQLSLLTECAEVLLSLVFPMRWSHAYIPVLPHFLIPMLSAPMPYLCGIDKSNLADTLLDLSRDCVVVDLDKNQVSLGPGMEPLPSLPAVVGRDLRERLERNVGMVFREARSLTKNDDCSEMGFHLAPHVKLMADAMWESRLCLFDEAFNLSFTPEEERKNTLNGNDNSGLDASDGGANANDPYAPLRMMTHEDKLNQRTQSQWDAVQEAFLDTYAYMLRNYRRFLIFPSKENEGSYGGAGFRAKEFVQSQRYDMQDFLQQLLDTQMFDDFITKRLYGSGEADVTFFDTAVDRALKNQSLIANVNANVGSSIRKASDSLICQGPTETTGVKVTAGASNSRMSGVRGLFGRAGKGINAAAKNATSSSKAAPAAADVRGDTPLLQSARVHRKLKTIVPPEPSGADLPPRTPAADDDNSVGDGPIDLDNVDPDNLSVGSNSTNGTRTTVSSITRGSALGSPTRSARSGRSSSYVKRQEQLAAALDKEKKSCYVYPTFPAKLNAELFGTPRPMSSVVLAEFDRQKEQASKFRRMEVNTADDRPSRLKVHRRNTSVIGSQQPEKPLSAEVATFSVFFMAFTAVVGKELLEISSNTLSNSDDRTILSTVADPAEDDSYADSVASALDEIERQAEESLEDRSEEELKDAERENGGVDAAKKEMERLRQGGSENEAHSAKEENEQKTNEASIAEEDEFEDASSEEPAESVRDDERDLGDGTEKESETALDGETDTAAKLEGSGGLEEGEETGDITNEIKQAAEGLNKFDLNGKDNNARGTDLASEDEKETAVKNLITPEKEKFSSDDSEKPRNRFRDKLSTLQIMEAKATARAQLGIAFEMLKMMKERGLKADPEAYQSLIDACGRCGDTEGATKLLARMHEDDIVADGVVYASLVSAFTAENAYRKVAGETNDDLPEWANGAAMDMDWNKLQNRRSYIDIAKQRFANAEGEQLRPVRALQNFISRNKGDGQKKPGNGKDRKPQVESQQYQEQYVTDQVLRQILLGENLLEIVYPDISIDTDDELCPRCNGFLTDDEVVTGWTPGSSQEYTTKCPFCLQKFVPHFCVQSTSPTFVGSKGPSSALLCERLSPWVLQKELRNVMADRESIEDLLSPEWREKETKNAVLWWNLILSFMRYRLPFTFLLQGSFDQNLIAPTPDGEES